MIAVDAVIRNIRQLVNPGSDRVARGQESGSLRIQENVCIGARQGMINFIGSEADCRSHCQLEAGGLELDACACVALPGLVDPHTHLPFAGTRQDEFSLKLQGVSYQEIASRGGGIKGTVPKPGPSAFRTWSRSAGNGLTRCCSAARRPWKPKAVTAWTWRPN